MAGSSGGGGHYPPALLQAFAARLACNFDAMIYFAASFGLLMSVFIAFHLIRVLAARTGIPSSTSSLAAPFVKTSRVLRRILVRKVPLLPSAGHAWLAVLYLSLNLVLTFTPLVNHTMLSFQTNIASRTGWLSMGNICVAVFLGLKNTPLGFLTTWSYERLNVLHRIVGYTAMAQCIIHASAYSSYFIALGNMARLRVAEEIYGMVAGFAMLTMVVVAFAIRRRCYEVFYAIHVSFFIITMIFLGFHQPESSKRMIYAVMAVCGTWVLDRIIRVVRLVMYSVNNSVTVHPLPHGGTRITLQKAPAGARSGRHCFIWIPKIRTWEMHPFTIANVDPLEFVVASYDGFTRDLHEYATANPGTALRASVEGSYGQFPDPIMYDKVVLIAGGSGASFAVGMAMDMLKHVKTDTRRSVTFVWAVKYHDHLEWFSGHLATIHHALEASVRLCVTSAASPARIPGDPVESASTVRRMDTVTSASSSDTLNFKVDKVKTEANEKHKSTSLMPSRILTRQLSDPEKSGSDCEPVSPVDLYPVFPSDTGISPIQLHQATIQPGMSLHGLQIEYTRPDISSIISEAVESTPRDKRVLIMGCGPDGLMKQVRNATACQIRTSGPAVELHCEQFGW